LGTCFDCFISQSRDFLADKTTGYYAMAVTAVPEPEIYTMLLAGLGLLGWRVHNPRS
jgi:hypothetical protein